MFFLNKEKLTGMAFPFLLVLTSTSIFAQQNNNWILFNSGLKLNWVSNNVSVDSVFNPYYYYEVSRTSTISNLNGNMLFYVGANTIWNKNFQLMEGAPDTSNQTNYFFILPGQNLILPIHNDTSIYNVYLAQEASNSFYPPFSSLIKYTVAPWHVNLWQPYDGKVLASDTLFNGGSFYSSQTLNAIKHGNGQDWWILFHPNETDSFMVWRQEQDGSLSGPFYQEIGPYHPQQGYDWMRIAFTPDGTKMALMMMFNIWIYDFDRCSGQLSNPVVIDTCTNCWDDYANFNYPSTPYNAIVFSSEGSKLYAVRADSLIQFDLTNYQTVIQREVIWHSNVSIGTQNCHVIHSIQLGLDQKIYVGTATLDAINPLVLDSGRAYLGVIHSPNLSGVSCNFDRYGLYLNGYKSDMFLPSQINYDLGPLVNSPCDTLTTTGISEQSTKPQITLAPNPAHTQATLTWLGVKEGSFVLRDMLGRSMLQQEITASSGSIKLDLSTLSKGIYLWQVQSAEYSKNGKLVVE
jgi:hypothetical protein